jgi:hypothetical protein
MHGVLLAPQWGGTIVIANAVASAAGVALPPNADKIALANSSGSAIAFFRVTTYLNTADVGSGTAASATADMPVVPGQQIQVFVGNGLKTIRAIASAADGNLYVTPGSSS